MANGRSLNDRQSVNQRKSKQTNGTCVPALRPIKKTKGSRSDYGGRMELEQVHEPIRLNATSRRIRMAAILVLLVVVVAGTFWGSDDHFPFGPFRMYSVANKTDGEIRVPALEVTTESGKRMELDFEVMGLRRAEIEGQVDRFLTDPTLLRHLVTSYERLHDSAERLVELRLIERVNYLRDGRTYRTDDHVLVSWSRS